MKEYGCEPFDFDVRIGNDGVVYFPTGICDQISGLAGTRFRVAGVKFDHPKHDDYVGDMEGI